METGMTKFHVLTLFPEMVEQGLSASILGRAAGQDLIRIHAVDIRDYTLDKHGKVDDYPYGGGAGMLLQAQPVYDAWRAVAGQGRPRTVYVTPQGTPFTQSYAAELAEEEELVFLCGHYEGIDDRVLEEVVTDFISIGDYVLTGGELPAMVMIDAIARLVPGVLHNDESAQTESFHRALLEYPQYSRPEVWNGRNVPEVLLSGDHKKIAGWRLEQSEKLTRERRPDLYAKYREQEDVIRRLASDKRRNLHMMQSLSRGRGEIVVNTDGNLLIYDRGCRLCLFSAADRAGAERLLAAMPAETESAVTCQAFLNAFLQEHAGFRVRCECRQACYTERSPLPVRHKDIRLLEPEHLAYLTMQCGQEWSVYLGERIRAKALYGAFLENRPVGFAGSCADGSLGILYVEESCRGRGIGGSLEAFCINRQLELGYVPYGQICADNQGALLLQERLGLYLSKESIWRLERETACQFPRATV